MTITKISDVIVPEVFADYALEKTRERSKLYKSGILVSDDRLNQLAVKGGVEVTIPFWKTLSGSDQVLSDTSPLTVSGIQAGVQKAHVLARGNAWSSNDLAKAFSGSDPMGAIAVQTADWWNQQYQNTLLSILKGVFATALATSHTVSLGEAKIDATSFVDAQKVLSDAGDELSAIYMHSDVYYDMIKKGLITFEALDSTNKVVELKNYAGSFNANPQVPTFNGMAILHEKNASLLSAGVYSTYVFKKSAIGMGDANAPVPVETDREKLAGNDFLIMRRHYLLHPYGLSFNASAGTAIVGSSPTNAELEAGAKWTKVVSDDRDIGIVRITSKG
ncbi:MAG: coat protein [Oscillospiraceae bacterium]